MNNFKKLNSDIFLVLVVNLIRVEMIMSKIFIITVDHAVANLLFRDPAQVGP